MKEFFKRELKTLQAKTGIRQFENLMQEPDWQEKMITLINIMIEEANKPPFDIVKSEVKERVIADAIINDPDFIGLNAKFVRKSLKAWWDINGGRVIEAMNEKPASVYEKVKLTPEQDKAVNVLLESYHYRLQNQPVKYVPKMEADEIKKKGAEWTSGIERKATNYNNGLTMRDVMNKQVIRRAASEFYKGRHSFNFQEKPFVIDGYEIIAESKEDAEAIYKIASQG